MKSDPPPASPPKRGDSKRRRDWLLAVSIVVGLGAIAPLAISRLGRKEVVPREPRAADAVAPKQAAPEGIIATVSGANAEVGWKALKSITGPILPRLPYELSEALIRFGSITSTAAHLVDEGKPFAAVVGVHGKTPYVVAAFRLRDRAAFDREVFEGPLSMFEPAEHAELALTRLQSPNETAAHFARTGDWVLVATAADPLLSAGPFVAQTLAPKVKTEAALDFRVDRQALRAYGPLLLARGAKKTSKQTAAGELSESLLAPFIASVRTLAGSGESAALSVNVRGSSVLAQGKLTVSANGEGAKTLSELTSGSTGPLLLLAPGAAAKATWHMRPSDPGSGALWAKAFSAQLGVPVERLSRLGGALSSLQGARGESHACALYKVPEPRLECRFDKADTARFSAAMKNAAAALDVPSGDGGAKFGKVEVRDKVHVVNIVRPDGGGPLAEVAWLVEGDAVRLVVAEADAVKSFAANDTAREKRIIRLVAAHPEALAAIATWPQGHMELVAGSTPPVMAVAIVRAPDGVMLDLEADRDALWAALATFKE